MKLKHTERWAGKTKDRYLSDWPDERSNEPVVLLAEDDEAMRLFLTEALEEQGFRVIAVKNGKEAVQRAIDDQRVLSKRSEIDVMVMDVFMPGVTGLEVLEQLRQASWNTSVVLISAFADEAVYTEAARLGDAVVLKKPFCLTELLDAVHAAIGPVV